MNGAFYQLFVGLAFAIVLIYLLIVVNFQSWLDPFVIVLGLPAALAGIVWMLFSPARRCPCPRSPARSCAWAWPPRTPSWSSVSRVSGWNRA